MRACAGRRRAVLRRRQRHLTLSVFPTYSGGTLYVPYQVFDSQPCGVTPSYNQAKQTYVLLSRTRQMIFDLAAGTVSDESGSVSTANAVL